MDKIVSCGDLKITYENFIDKEQMQIFIKNFWHSMEKNFKGKKYNPDLFPHHIWSNLEINKINFNKFSEFKELIINSRVYCLSNNYRPIIIKEVQEVYNLR